MAKRISGINQKFGIISLGCPKNLVDSEQTIALLERAGYIFTGNLDDANIILVNTCSFIESSKKESVETILETVELKKTGACEKLVVMGCLPQLYKKELMQQIPEIDAVVGTGDYPQMASIIADLNQSAHLVNITKPENLQDLSLPRRICTLPHTAYLKISEGCDHICTFCIIPRLRGKQRSRPMEEIVNEAKQLGQQGVKEINLIAQDLTDYGRDRYGKRQLAVLLRELNQVDSIQWIRLLYTYPSFITDELITAIKECNKVVKYIDVPIQHAADSILKSMRRNTTQKKIKAMLGQLRTAIPGITIRTTLIVGYPGETRDDYLQLLDFVKEMEFERLGAFTYSREKRTESYDLTPQIPKATREKRLAQVLALQEDVIHRKQQELVDKPLQVLVDQVNEDALGWSIGRHAGQAPDIDGVTYLANPKRLKLKPGDMVQALVTHYEGYDLYADITKKVRT